MAKQTFTTGQVLTAAQMTSLQQTAMGGGSATAKTASYTLVAADAGTVVRMNSASATTITVNTSLFAAGDTVYIQNIGAGVCTITAGTATVNTASSLALAQYEGGTLYFTAASASLFFKEAPAAAGGSGPTYAVFQDVKSSGGGGTFTSGAFRTRDLQTSQFNGITGCSLASNQITLAAGTYIVNAMAPAGYVDQHQTRFYNITDSSVAVIGGNAYNGITSSSVDTYSALQGGFTIAGSKVFELQHQCTTTKNGTGFGTNNGFGNGEVFSIVTIAKVA